MTEGLTIKKANEGLKSKNFSAVELAQSFLDKIGEKDKKIFAFLNLNKGVISKAKEVDKLIAKGKEIPLLSGIPFAVKDNILVKGLKCTAGSKILKDYVAPYTATTVERLEKEGSLILGKTNLDEFAMGSSNEYSAFGATHNPLDLERVPGGSSGGSAAAVSASMSLFALGSDTGGSIRQPAGFCGVVGLKPTYGSVSRYGLIAMASSLDQIGPITKTVEDAEIVFRAMSGKDEMDSTSVDLPKVRDKKSSFKIGIPKEFFVKGMDKEVEEGIKDAILRLEKQGVKFEEVSLPHCTDYALAAYYIIMPSEASSNLARYDGIKYGFSDKGAKSLKEVYFNSREKGFGKEVIRRIMLGTFALSSGYYEAYYLRAQKVRTLIRKDFESAFSKVDAILTPTFPNLPFRIGEKTKDPLSMYLSDIFLVAVNLAGLCAIALPLGNKKLLTPSMQIIGKPFAEDTIFKIGKLFEKTCQKE